VHGKDAWPCLTSKDIIHLHLHMCQKRIGEQRGRGCGGYRASAITAKGRSPLAWRMCMQPKRSPHSPAFISRGAFVLGCVGAEVQGRQACKKGGRGVDKSRVGQVSIPVRGCGRLIWAAGCGGAEGSISDLAKPSSGKRVKLSLELRFQFHLDLSDKLGL